MIQISSTFPNWENNNLESRVEQPDNETTTQPVKNFLEKIYLVPYNGIGKRTTRQIASVQQTIQQILKDLFKISFPFDIVLFHLQLIDWQSQKFGI